jgi:hypothetical protein
LSLIIKIIYFIFKCFNISKVKLISPIGIANQKRIIINVYLWSLQEKEYLKDRWIWYQELFVSLVQRTRQRILWDSCRDYKQTQSLYQLHFFQRQLVKTSWIRRLRYCLKYLKKKKNLFFYLFQINICFMFSNDFVVLMSKIIF